MTETSPGSKESADLRTLPANKIHIAWKKNEFMSLLCGFNTKAHINYESQAIITVIAASPVKIPNTIV